MTASVPIVDLVAWQTADAENRASLAKVIDDILQTTGVFLLAGHGVPAELTARMRTTGRAFFHLPWEQKAPYAMQRPEDNGWRGLPQPQGVATGGTGGAPDLHEAFHMGPTHRTGDDAFDALYYPANKWPAELPELRETALAYTAHMTRVADAVMKMLAEVLGLEPSFFTSRCEHATWTQSVNWYPPLHNIGETAEGQMRIGPHTDFGTITLLDRQQGVSGLEVWNEVDGWFAPPFAEGTLVVNMGDLMNQWTDGRWRSLRHRVLAPSASAPQEELTSLVYFLDADPDAEIMPLAAPVGGGAGMPAVIAGEWILKKNKEMLLGLQRHGLFQD
ncbi:oxidoreductase [Streptomyces hygroscopicus subsp. jinggangensis 5008]|uniref:Oxidoreductase n=1 Tax=Streptomyces hygroscopicus subsp. jinggangensis TaxID=311982 RepID=Q1L2K6_STRHY|nr:oxidoreductase [Streptomyces hygroscopicus subsp. jinggangensis]AEY85558.1 oxidoreductase [Streptomyces hygroscopicus subsp. jinggangensis 5008]AGF59780.1 oxidoreductase [Streptomyces hygroscopicus subsp. jinggangensis TL01]